MYIADRDIDARVAEIMADKEDEKRCNDLWNAMTPRERAIYRARIEAEDEAYEIDYQAWVDKREAGYQEWLAGGEA